MSGGMLVVLPVIAQETTDVCVESILRADSAAGLKPEELLVVDNSRDGWAADRYGLRTHRDPDGHNLGTSRAWNVGACEVMDRGLDYLVIMSASMLFGPIMHTTLRRQLDTFWGSKVIEADGHSWHCIAFHRSVFETVGLFDTNFHVYHEATDFGYRLRMCNLEWGWPHVWVNALSQGVALHAPLVSCPAGPPMDYYKTKWNGEKGSERHVQPFGSKPMGYFEDVPIPELARRYGWTTWW